MLDWQPDAYASIEKGETTMISIEFADFPADELEKLKVVYSEQKVSSAEFFIYATIPKIDAADISLFKRIVYVDYVPTAQQQEYPAAREQNWERPTQLAIKRT